MKSQGILLVFYSVFSPDNSSNDSNKEEVQAFCFIPILGKPNLSAKDSAILQVYAKEWNLCDKVFSSVDPSTNQCSICAQSL